MDRDEFYKDLSRQFSELTKFPAAIQDHIDATTLAKVEASARNHVAGKQQKLAHDYCHVNRHHHLALNVYSR